MKVNMDGFRKQATNNINDLASFILDNQEALKDAVDIDELLENFDAVASSIGINNCIFDKTIENYSDLSNVLNVIRLEVDSDGIVVESD